MLMHELSGRDSEGGFAGRRERIGDEKVGV